MKDTKTATKFTHQQQLLNWSRIIDDCRKAKSEGIKVCDWLKSHDISHDTYYYWLREVRKACINNNPAEIVPVPAEIIAVSSDSTIPSGSVMPGNYNHPDAGMRIIINDTVIEISGIPSVELLANVIKAVRYA